MTTCLGLGLRIRKLGHGIQAVNTAKPETLTASPRAPLKNIDNTTTKTYLSPNSTKPTAKQEKATKGTSLKTQTRNPIPLNPQP